MKELEIFEIKTCRAFEKDIDETHRFVDKMKKIASERGYVFRAGRGHVGPHISFHIALYYRLQGLDPIESVDQFVAEFMINPGDFNV